LSEQFPSNSFPDSLKGVKIGVTAKNLCTQNALGLVIGQSSRGLFLRLPSDWIIYLSEEEWPGPLTLILTDSQGRLQRIEQGEQAQIHSWGIEFLNQGLVIDITQAQVWQATPPTANAFPLAEIKSRLVDLIEHLQVGRSNRDLEQLLNRIQQSKINLHIDVAKTESYLIPTLSDAQQNSPDQVIKACEVLLGRGSGLTPAGDDIILGLLLAFRRWGSILYPMPDLKKVLLEVPQAAHMKTTTLSANLIECASQGQADLRLIQALDGLITGQPDLDICAEYLADWGSSSGVEVLCGIGAVLAAGI
jgi:hypothetical protein